MKRSFKLFALLAALVLLLSTFAGCKMPDTTSETQTITVESETNSSVVTPEPTATPEPTFEVSEDTAALFDALDLEVFCWYATTDGYTFHMFVDEPESFGIDASTVPMTLGEFTEEDSKRLGVEAGVYLDKLNAIDREKLPEDMQLSYDVLAQILVDFSEETEFEYMYEPLTEYSGIHANLPLSFALFELKDTQDIDDYLTLLADVPRYMGQVLAYEQQRAELGYFMTEDALNTILDDIQTIVDSRETSFLYATFNDAIDQLDLPDEQAQAYKDQNASLIANEFIDAYESLYDGLKKLRSNCRTYEEAAMLTEKQKSYFEYSMQSDACNFLSVEETLEMLKDEYLNLLYDIIALQSKNPDLYNMNIDLSSGDMETDLNYLKGIMTTLLPELPEHDLTLTDVPEELESMFSPAAYVIPALDEWKENTVYINTANEDPTLLLTLAHECYPGHLYQYVYQRSLDNVCRMQKVVNFGGYAEGWAQFAEYLVVENQTQYDHDFVQYNFDYGMMFNAILPAMISIIVNYYGYSESALESYITGIGLDGAMIANIYYPIVIDQPYYFFEYAVGYSQLAQMYRDISADLGDEFNMEAFLETYMNMGPGYFGMIKEKMDIWADSVMNDNA